MNKKMKKNSLKNILIIRSVSFQQLDQNLAALVKSFPPAEHEFHLLTHGHGMERARTYDALSVIIDYQSRKNFSVFHIPPSLSKRTLKKGESYEAIIVPVTNKTGLGFLNVLAMTLRIPSKTIYICNMVSELLGTPRIGIVIQVMKASFFSLLSGVMALVTGVVMLPFLLIRLMFRKR
jgi:hypothetical protein